MRWVLVGVADVAALAISIACARPGTHLLVAGAWLGVVLVVIAAVTLGD